MKQRLLTIVTFFMIVCMGILCTPSSKMVYAAVEEAKLSNITDTIPLLSDEQYIELQTWAENVSEKYQCGVYIILVEDYWDYSSGGDVYMTTTEIFHEYHLGMGENRNGITLLLSMEDRDYALFAHGNESEYAFDEYGLIQLEESFLDELGDDDWYGGLYDYIKTCESFLQKASEGKPVRYVPIIPMLIAIGVANLIALIVCGVLKNQMKSVALQKQASIYVSDTLNITESQDKYIRTSRTRVKNSSSSDNDSKSHSGGGGSGRSGKF